MNATTYQPDAPPKPEPGDNATSDAGPLFEVEVEISDPVTEAYGKRIRDAKDHGIYAFGPGSKPVRTKFWDEC